MLKEKRRQQAEQLLLQERERVLEAIARFDDAPRDLLERTGELSLYRFHPADIGSETMEQEKEFLLASVEGRRLYAIDDALRRLYKDPERYGVCARCGEEIAWERLQVVPEAEHCADCQRELEGDSPTA
jgi:DnaK suppressor protein